jgi:hypothetical protein
MDARQAPGPIGDIVMTTWNVAFVIVDIIDAETADDAERELRRRIESAGFTVYRPDDPTSVNVETIETD